MKKIAQCSPGAVANGVGFGLLFTAFQWVWDAIEGTVPPWPRWALVYGGVAVLGGTVYGLLWCWLERRSAKGQ